MILERTLPAVWTLHGSDVPALAHVASRATAVVVEDVETLCSAIVVDVSRSDAPYVPTGYLAQSVGYLLGRVVEVLPKYDPTRGRALHDPWTDGFRAWLHAELTNDLIDHWRSWSGRNGQKRTTDPEPDAGLVGCDPDDPAIKIILSGLPKRHRVVAIMLMRGMSVREIALRQGVSRPQASGYISDLRDALRESGLAPVPREEIAA